MSDAWKTYRGVPDPGARICALEDVPEGGTRCLMQDGFPILLVRIDAGVHAFVNACPHQFLPLDQRSDRVLSADGTRLICTNHDAAFDAATGQGVGGLVAGQALDPIPVAVKDGQIVVG